MRLSLALFLPCAGNAAGSPEPSDPQALFELAGRYARGEGLERNETEAFRWYQKAAKAGHRNAQFNLAALYSNGQGTARNYAEAAKWWRTAAEAGHGKAQLQLALAFENGRGVPHNSVEAYKWFWLAAGNGEDATLHLERLRTSMTPKQYASARYLAGQLHNRIERDKTRAMAPPRKAPPMVSEAFPVIDPGKLAPNPDPARPALSAPRPQTPVPEKSEAPTGPMITGKEDPPARTAPATAPSPPIHTPPPEPETAPAGFWIALTAAAAFVSWSMGRRARIGPGPTAPLPESKPAPLPPPPRTKPDPAQNEEEAFQLLDYETLMAGVADRDACRRNARHYDKPARIQKFLSQNSARPPAFYDAYALAFMSLGNLRAAMALLALKASPKPEDEETAAALKQALGEGKTGRLGLASEFCRRKLFQTALDLMDNAAVEAAAQSEGGAREAAGIFSAAGRTADFIKRLRAGLDAQIYRNCAAAFRSLNEPQTVLRLLSLKPQIEPEDYPFLAAARKALGGLEELRPAQESHRLALAQALMDEGEDRRALSVLIEERRSPPAPEEYAAALRLCFRLGDFGAAEDLYETLRKESTLKESAELHYYFALFCEKKGRLAQARDIYQRLIESLGAFKDAGHRLGRLDALPEEEASRLTAVGASGPGAQGAPLVLAGKFELRKPLGIGGMGIVYKGWDRALSRDVAVKKMLAALMKDARFRARFIDEARLVAGLNHPYIVSIHDILSVGGETYLIFEYVDGETLAEVVAGRGAVDPGECLRILGLVCEALAYAHGRGIIHRDLKPSNIMLDRRGYVKVMDFGLARHAQAGGPLLEKQGSGTPAYMAPEQHLGTATARSDIYALGATAYELLTGELPFPSGPLGEQKGAERYKPLPQSVPAGLRDLIASCLKADAARRPASVTSLLERLKETLA